MFLSCRPERVKGKTMENVRKHMKIELTSSGRRVQK